MNGGQGAVVRTPTCDPSSWEWVDAIGVPGWSEGWIQLDFRETALGSPSQLSWRGYVRAAGATIDVVPNAGPEHFVL